MLAGIEFELQQMEKDLDYVDRLHKETLTLKEKITSLSTRLVSSYSKVCICSFVSVSGLVEKLLGTLSRRFCSITQLRTLNSNYSQTLKEAIAEQGRYQEEYSGLQHEHSRLMDSKTRGEAKCNALRQRFYSIQDEHVALSTKMQGLKAMEERVSLLFCFLDNYV